MILNKIVGYKLFLLSFIVIVSKLVISLDAFHAFK